RPRRARRSARPNPPVRPRVSREPAADARRRRRGRRARVRRVAAPRRDFPARRRPAGMTLETLNCRPVAFAYDSMRLLAIDTSSRVGSIALLDGSDVSERFIATPREQAELVLPLVDDLLGARGIGLKDLDALVLGRGPGSFTGL